MSDPKKTMHVPLLKNSASASFVYFDEAPVYGQLQGTIAVELSANIVTPTPSGQTTIERVAVAHLRGCPAAMRSLAAAIEGALKLMAEPVKLAS